MKRILAVSPHLDDAVFSAGGALFAHAAAGQDVLVLTCFTGNVALPQGFALACQLDKGLGPDVDYMALRRAEDVAACTAIGARAQHLPFLEAPHRGYASAPKLFAGRRADDDAVAPLAAALADEIAAFDPDRIYGPLCVGDHVDHGIVRQALEQVAGQRDVIWWEDYPYAMRADEPAKGVVRLTLEPDQAAAKLAGVLAYTTQLGFQFGGPDAARETLGAWRSEGFVL